MAVVVLTYLQDHEDSQRIYVEYISAGVVDPLLFHRECTFFFIGLDIDIDIDIVEWYDGMMV